LCHLELQKVKLAIQGIAGGVASVTGVIGSAQGTGSVNYGVYGEASGATNNWAGYFGNGNVFIQNTLVLPTSAGFGKVLTSDATGNATWQNLPQIGFYAGNDPVPAISIPANTWTTIVFSSASPGFINDGGGYNSGTGEYIPPVPGVYQINTVLNITGTPGESIFVNLRYAAGFISNFKGIIDVNGNLTVPLSATIGTAGFGAPWWVEVSSTGVCQWDEYSSSFSGHLVYAY